MQVTGARIAPYARELTGIARHIAITVHKD